MPHFCIVSTFYVLVSEWLYMMFFDCKFLRNHFCLIRFLVQLTAVEILLRMFVSQYLIFVFRVNGFVSPLFSNNLFGSVWLFLYTLFTPFRRYFLSKHRGHKIAFLQFRYVILWPNRCFYDVALQGIFYCKFQAIIFCFIQLFVQSTLIEIILVSSQYLIFVFWLPVLCRE